METAISDAEKPVCKGVEFLFPLRKEQDKGRKSGAPGGIIRRCAPPPFGAVTGGDAASRLRHSARTRGASHPPVRWAQVMTKWLENLEGNRKSGAPGGIRTPDQQDRNLLLYPAELRVRKRISQKRGRIILSDHGLGKGPDPLFPPSAQRLLRRIQGQCRVILAIIALQPVLGFVHGQVGVAQQGFTVLAVVRVAADADADPYLQG